ncbi:NAD(P)-dependent oxidoreductase [Alloalcanivorax mobilis]|uniref:NAD(P)-dependent oxidoreductase n=1 Tax=Alloalcanivorax mobilis TaxID=2019569 RepID=UPI000C793F68|nr:NAD(P)-dependent oxidoreductase [Alloalcanivorax mobilis]
MTDNIPLGFIGLGVMGAPMASNLTRKSGHRVHVFDLDSEQVNTLTELGAQACGSVAAVAEAADMVFLSLPGIAQVEEVADALLAAPRRPATVIDMSTSDVARTRALAEKLAQGGIELVDAPVARLREAARNGTLLITVGGSDEQFARVQPLLAHMGSDIVHCGGTGCGQVVKILNNMLVFMNVNALAEALTIGRAAGVDGELLFNAISLGSGDSFALRHPGLNNLVPDHFPEKAFPTDYAIKDISLALALAESGGVRAQAATRTRDLLCRTRDAGLAKNYYPAMIQLIDGRVKG